MEGAERREHTRGATGLHVKYRRPDGSECTSLSRIVNVSEGGLQIVCHDPMRVHTVLEMNLSGTHDSRPVSMAGEVVWIKPAPGTNGTYYSGVRFLELNEDARALVLSQLG
jgi:hypothetical protein